MIYRTTERNSPTIQEWKAAIETGHNDMRGANLREADLIEADLRGADLSGATFCRAFLDGAIIGDGLQGHPGADRLLKVSADEYKRIVNDRKEAK